MRIAMIGLRGIPSKDGGVEVAVSEIAPRLVSLNVDCTVYCRSNYIDKPLKKINNINLVNLPTINTKHLEAIIHTFISTVHAIFARFDIIHYHAGGNALFCWLPRIFGIKTVVTLHGQDWQRAKWGIFAKFILRLGERIGVIFSNITISVSQKIVSYYSNYKIIHLPNGISEEQYQADNSIIDKYQLQDYILYLGRIVPEKGIDLLIKAYIQSERDEQLVIVGDITHTQKYLNELKELSKDNNKIIFTGSLYNGKKKAIIENAKLFILPSYLEGMPIVLLEMMNASIPCIVSDIPEIIEVVKNNNSNLCTIFKSGDSSELSKKLDIVLDNIDSYKDKAINTKEYIVAKYHWDYIVLETKNIYSRLLNNK